ncbi:hypothetical protein ACVLD2_001002 [Paenibacillus sp. PvR052]
MTKDIIEVFIQNKSKAEFRRPLEVEHAIWIWLYLRQRELPYPVAGVRVYIDERWTIDKELPALIFKEQFDKLYDEYGVNNQLNKDEIIRKMALAWIGEQKYERRDLD